MPTTKATTKIYNWTLFEAIEQACAALPDPSFAQQFGIDREDLRRIQLTVEQGADALDQDKGAKTLHLAISLLPKAWPDPKNPPDRSLLVSLRRTLNATGVFPDSGLSVESIRELQIKGPVPDDAAAAAPRRPRLKM